MSACKSCDQPIRWVVMASTGKRMPLDEQPRDDGNVRLLGSSDPSGLPIAEYVRGGEPASQRFVPHFASCPEADKYRKSDAKRAQRAGRRRGIFT